MRNLNRNLNRSGPLAIVAAMAIIASPAVAAETVHPHDLEAQVAKRPHVQLSDGQRTTIRDALVSVHTQQKAPDGFAPKAGAKLPKELKITPLPQSLARQDPAFGQLDYAKTAKDLLVVDPMDKTIVAVIPRRYPASGKAMKPADWASTRGRELTGQGTANRPHQPAGDAGDTANGDVQKSKQQ